MHSNRNKAHRHWKNCSDSISRHQLTKHASRRSQQRAIPEACIPLIRAYGNRYYDGRGGVTYLMTYGAIDGLIRTLGRNEVIERLEGVYIVVDAEEEQKVITVGHYW